MIVLDTNVVSEPLRPEPCAAVVAWLDAQPLETLYLSAITLAELRAGAALLPKGRRQQVLADQLENRIVPMFAGRVLAFDAPCTPAYAQILSSMKSAGQAIGTADALIAAIASTWHFAVATRDESPFSAAGVTVINPWQHV